jgi:NAD(P)-dependent dehydrogenase (short-subunit alcohol dehydrogenase family)
MDVAIVSGGAEGIGLAIAQRLAGCGYRVVIADLQAKGDQAAQGIDGIFVPCDVSLEGGWADVESAARRAGTPKVLVNNAGINPGPEAFADYPLERWRRLMSVNLDGAFLGCRTAVRLLQPGGAIVNIASAAARLSSPEMAGYAASKAAVLSLTRSVAMHCARAGLGLRCNAVLPGSVETPMVERLRSQTGDADAARARTAARHPLGFVGAPQDIAGAVAWLVSPEARFVTGAEVAVDGGLTL